MLRRALLLAVLAALGLPGVTHAAVPRGYVGMMVDDALLEHPKFLDSELRRMRGDKVTSIRVVLRWDAVVRCKTCRPDWRKFDRVVLAAAKWGVSVLPVLLSAPAYLARNPGDPTQVPRHPDDLGGFARLAVARYEPGGSLWLQHPEIRAWPIRTWQVWNEPDHKEYLPATKDWARSYVDLLRPAATAIREQDPGAKVMLAGFAGRSWDLIDSVYRNGGGPYFDEIAVHPYTKYVDDVLRVVRYVRATQREWKDLSKPVFLTEAGWTGARGRKRKVPSWCTFCLTERDAARSLGRLLPMLARQRARLDIGGVYVYTWMTSYAEPSPFDYAGLRMYRRGKVTSTPSYFSFLRALTKLR